jgi:hypothetical protein
MNRSTTVALLAATVVAAPILAGCSGGGSAAAPKASTTSGPVATRWWSTSVAPAGSTIDSKSPANVASRLHSSQTEYCGMLRQTLAAGHSILPNVTAADPALLTSSRAFVAELEAVAPSQVAGPVKVVGDAVLALVGSGGDPARVKGIDAAAVSKAASMVAANAKRSCGVDLSSGSA